MDSSNLQDVVGERVAPADFTVSVVIPLFNKEIAIKSTILSVLAQTRLPDELIIIDDGSTDESVHIARACLRESETTVPWRIVEQCNTGEGAARNAGAREATCSYIAFLDADDEWLPEYLSQMERLAVANPSATVLTIRTSRRNSKGAVVAGPSPLGDHYFGRVERPINVYRRGTGLLNSSAVAIRRDAWERCGGFHERAAVGADVTLWLKLGASETFAHSGRPLSIWRDEYSGVQDRKWNIPEQLRYFLGTIEGRSYLDNSDLVRFLEKNIILQIAVYSLVRNTEIRQDLRRFALSLPWPSRVKCMIASVIPAWFYRGIGRLRRLSRELAPA